MGRFYGVIISQDVNFFLQDIQIAGNDLIQRNPDSEKIFSNLEIKYQKALRKRWNTLLKTFEEEGRKVLYASINTTQLCLKMELPIGWQEIVRQMEQPKMGAVSQ